MHPLNFPISLVNSCPETLNPEKPHAIQQHIHETFRKYDSGFFHDACLARRQNLFETIKRLFIPSQQKIQILDFFKVSK